jgi:HlyD family secretion protein
MKRTLIIFGVVFALLFISVGYLLRAQNGNAPDIIYRTEEARIGDAVRSFTATGVLQPLTVVDVKSKAGGEVIRLAVQEGDFVRKGDLIAIIDPRDTEALYAQAQADLEAAQARKRQNELTLEMQRVSSRTALEQAEANLASARIRLQTAQQRMEAQPKLTQSAIEQAQANYDSAVKALDQLERVTIPQMRAQVQGDYNRSKADLDAAKANYERQQQLYEKGYVPKSAVDQARSQYEAATASFKNAEEKLRTLEDDLRLQLETAKSRVTQARAALDQAKANEIQVQIVEREYQDARQAVRQAEAQVEQARANLKQIDLRLAELDAADAAIVRSRASVENARVQLQSTTVVAPRDGVIVRKYVEEGTVIPPGTSVFSEGTSIVQIADVSKMYVEVFVDEADIGQVYVGQKVLVSLESNPNAPLEGRVARIYPSAVVNSGITQVRVRVEVESAGLTPESLGGRSSPSGGLGSAPRPWVPPDLGRSSSEGGSPNLGGSAPRFQRPEGAGGEGAPRFQRPEGAGGEGAPRFRRPEGAGSEGAPRFQRPEGAGSEGAPRFQRPEGAGGEGAPRFRRPEGAGVEGAPRFQRPEGAGVEGAPRFQRPEVGSRPSTPPAGESPSAPRERERGAPSTAPQREGSQPPLREQGSTPQSPGTEAQAPGGAPFGGFGGRGRRGGQLRLMPGLNASCEFIISEKRGVLVVPANAIQREGGKTYVEVMVAENKPEKREVRIGAIGDTFVEVLEGVKEGEKVVTSKIDRRRIEEEQRRMEQAAQQRSPFSGPGMGGGMRPPTGGARGAGFGGGR